MATPTARVPADMIPRGPKRADEDAGDGTGQEQGDGEGRDGEDGQQRAVAERVLEHDRQEHQRDGLREADRHADRQGRRQRAPVQAQGLDHLLSGAPETQRQGGRGRRPRRR